MRRLILGLSFLLAASPCFSQIKSGWVHADYASAQIETYRKHHDVPGLSIAIEKKGQIIFAKGFGFGDVERSVPVRTTDYFRLASVSKPITATMIFELAEQGKLSLDAPVRQYVPELPAHHIYRVRDLLSHQSGVRHYASDPPLKNYPTSMSALDRFVKDPLKFVPGEKSVYSTHAFTILGAVIEKVAKKPYRLYAADRMKAWGIEGVQCESGANPNRTKIYDRVQNKNRLVSRDDLSWKFPGGGYEATALGMCRLGSAILAGKILKPESLEKMWTVPKPRTGESTAAFGWQIYDNKGKKVAVHNGSQLGSNSRWSLSGDTVIIVLSNRSGHEPWEVLLFLEELIPMNAKEKLPTIKLKSSP